MPVAAMVLLVASRTIRNREGFVWGALVGILAFLGLGHTTAAILELKATYAAGPAAAAGTVLAGLLGGLGLGWILLGRSGRGGGPSAGAVAWSAVVFLALHSFVDGQVLGEAYSGPFPLGFTLTPLNASATFVHRFAEGALVVIPGLVAAWRPAKSLGLLSVGLLSLPAAYVPVTLFASGYSTSAFLVDQTIAMFASGLEAGLVVLLILVAFLPRAFREPNSMWALVAGLGFLAMLLVHFAVE